MKLRAIVNIGLIGAINAVGFMFGPLTVTLILRLLTGGSLYRFTEYDQTSWWFILSICAVGVLNFFLIKGCLDSNFKIIKFYHSVIPLAAWLLTTALFFVTKVWSIYCLFATGSFSHSNWYLLECIVLQVYSGLVIMISSTAAYIAHKLKNRSK